MSIFWVAGNKVKNLVKRSIFNLWSGSFPTWGDIIQIFWRYYTDLLIKNLRGGVLFCQLFSKHVMTITLVIWLKSSKKSLRQPTSFKLLKTENTIKNLLKFAPFGWTRSVDLTNANAQLRRWKMLLFHDHHVDSLRLVRSALNKALKFEHEDTAARRCFLLKQHTDNTAPSVWSEGVVALELGSLLSRYGTFTDVHVTFCFFCSAGVSTSGTSHRATRCRLGRASTWRAPSTWFAESRSGWR